MVPPDLIRIAAAQLKQTDILVIFTAFGLSVVILFTVLHLWQHVKEGRV